MTRNLFKRVFHFAGVLLVLLLFQWFGTLLSVAGHWPIPGTICGMILLFIALLLWPDLLKGMDGPSTFLLGHLSLLFIPAGAGIILAGQLLADNGVALLSTIFGSTIITLVLTGWAVQCLLPRQQKKQTDQDNSSC